MPEAERESIYGIGNTPTYSFLPPFRFNVTVRGRDVQVARFIRAYLATTPWRIIDYTMQLRYVRATARYSFTLYRAPLALRSGGANVTPCNNSYPDISE